MTQEEYKSLKAGDVVIELTTPNRCFVVKEVNDNSIEFEGGYLIGKILLLKPEFTIGARKVNNDFENVFKDYIYDNFKVGFDTCDNEIINEYLIHKEDGSQLTLLDVKEIARYFYNLDKQ